MTICKTKNINYFYQEKSLNLNNLPSELHISTMTITFNLATTFNVLNIGKYIDLSFGNILCVKYGPSGSNLIRSLIKYKLSKKKTKKKKKNFYNQASLVLGINNGKMINIKLFKNGAVQMTGCKNIQHFVDSLEKLFSFLLKEKAVYDTTEKKIVDKPFVSHPQNIALSKISDFKIRMINSNFHIGFLINREILYNILSEDTHVTCTYEPCIHACVNIKYNYQNKDTISIFVFESGSIIITGAKKKEHIIESYNYIIKKIYENYAMILKNNIEIYLENPEIKKSLFDIEI
jgi:TATA-box binding protein (TBP) (component of TFIID and TFIIIB)